MVALFSYGFTVFVVVTVPLFFAGALLVFVTTVLVDRRRVVLHLYTCFWTWFYVRVNPLWRCRIAGRQRVPWRGPAVIVANHASLVDILVLGGLYRPFKWVSKAAVFRVPFVGWNMWLNGYVAIERGDRRSIRKMMLAGRALLGAGCALLIFPEGTRSDDGELQPFHEGAFALATSAGCPVVPVAVTGTRDALPKHGMVLGRMDAHIDVLEPLDPAAFPSVEELRDAARAVIDAALRRRRPEPGAVHGPS